MLFRIVLINFWKYGYWILWNILGKVEKLVIVLHMINKFPCETILSLVQYISHVQNKLELLKYSRVQHIHVNTIVIAFALANQCLHKQLSIFSFFLGRFLCQSSWHKFEKCFKEVSWEHVYLRSDLNSIRDIFDFSCCKYFNFCISALLSIYLLSILCELL